MITFGDVCEEIFQGRRYTDRPEEMYSQGELFPMEVYKEMHQMWRKKKDEEYQQYINDVMDYAMKKSNFPFRAAPTKWDGEFDAKAFIESTKESFERQFKDVNVYEFEPSDLPEEDWFEGFADPDDIDYSKDDEDDDDEEIEDDWEDDWEDDDEDIDEDD